MEDAERDRIDHKYGVQLTGQCGFDQKGFDLLDKDTVASITDIKKLCGYSKYDSKIGNQIKDRQKKWHKAFDLVCDLLEETNITNYTRPLGTDTTLGGNATNGNSTVKKEETRVNRAFKNKPGEKKFYVALTKIVTKLKIRNILPVYDAIVVVHLCQYKQQENALTTEKLFNRLINLGSYEYEGFRPDKLYGAQEMSEGYKFKSHIDTSISAELQKIDVIKENVNIVKSWIRRLPEHSQWHLDISEHLGEDCF